MKEELLKIRNDFELDNYKFLLYLFEVILQELSYDISSEYDNKKCYLRLKDWVDEHIDEIKDDFVGEIHEMWLDKDDRFEYGQFYTPRDLVDKLLNRIWVDPYKKPSVVDFSCWTGWFLIKYLGQIDPSKLDSIQDLIEIFNNVTGVEIKEESYNLARLNVIMIFMIKAKYFDNIEYPDFDNIILRWDGLEVEKDVLENGYDYVVWNPPYLTLTTKDSYELRPQLQKDLFYRNFFYYTPNLVYFFIAQGIRKLNEGGRLWLIVPHNIMQNKPAKPLRDYILEKTKIIEIEDSGDEKLFEGTGIKNVIFLYLEKWDCDEDHTFNYIKN